MNRLEFKTYIGSLYGECLDIVERKNADYANSEDPFLNFNNSTAVDVSVERGILVRTMDKIVRISNLLDKEPDVVDESIHDSICDAINYLAILSAYIEDKSLKYLASKPTLINDCDIDR